MKESQVADLHMLLNKQKETETKVATVMGMNNINIVCFGYLHVHSFSSVLATDTPSW